MSDIRESELFSAYLDGEVTAAEQARVEQLLASDAAARRLMESLEALRARLQSLPAEKLGEDLSQRVLRAAEHRMLVGEDARPAPAEPPLRPWWREIHWRGMLSRRALVWSGLAVAIALMLKLNESEHPQRQAAPAIARAPQPAAEDSSPEKQQAAEAPMTARPAAPPPEIHAPGWRIEKAIAKDATERRHGEPAGDGTRAGDEEPAGGEKLAGGGAVARGGAVGGSGGIGGGMALPAGDRASGFFQAIDESRPAALAPHGDTRARDSEKKPGEFKFNKFGDYGDVAREKAARSAPTGGQTEVYADDRDEGAKPAPEGANFELKKEKTQQLNTLAQLDLKKAEMPAKGAEGPAKADVAKGMQATPPGATKLATNLHLDSYPPLGAKDVIKSGSGALSLSDAQTHGGGVTMNGGTTNNITGTLGKVLDTAGNGPAPAAPSSGRGGVAGSGVAGGAPNLKGSALPQPATAAPANEPLAEKPAGQSVAGSSAAPTPLAHEESQVKSPAQVPAERLAEGELRGTPRRAPASAVAESTEGLERSRESKRTDLVQGEADEAMVVECDVRPDVLQTRTFEQLLTRSGVAFRKEPPAKEAPRPSRESVVVYRVDATPAQVEGVLAQLAQDPKTFYRFAVKPPSAAAHRSLAELERVRKPEAAPAAPAGPEEYRRAADRYYARAQAGAKAAVEKQLAVSHDERRKSAGEKSSGLSCKVVFVLRVADQRPEAAGALKSDAKPAAPAKPAGKPADPARAAKAAE